ncbi:hypothetical protein BpHYR1_003520 [Brachionus plicatilis]|uniref:Uncharacterized protein n=1 Tax=Brachionus plicatilis TaxID=10195 RepID=A0A3M7RVJ2_BRAPC|nr:hypothetical protein BpHYR1_003520 [Brachionus plicatilis]
MAAFSPKSVLASHAINFSLISSRVLNTNWSLNCRLGLYWPTDGLWMDIRVSSRHSGLDLCLWGFARFPSLSIAENRSFLHWSVARFGSSYYQAPDGLESREFLLWVPSGLKSSASSSPSNTCR